MNLQKSIQGSTSFGEKGKKNKSNNKLKVFYTEKNIANGLAWMTLNICGRWFRCVPRGSG